MKFIVKNCFHWAGYHLIDLLLENGHEVVGIDSLDTLKKENLAMFVERNDLFTLKEDPIVHPDIFVEIIEADEGISLILIQNRKKHIVNVPYLMGEWMSEKKVRDLEINRENTKINELVYIYEVMSTLLDWLENKVYFSESIQIYSVNSKYQKIESMHHVLFQNSQPIDYYIEKVLDHYQQYHHLY